jgi:hypothetical protein
MSLLPMEAAASEDTRRLHQQHRLVLVVEEVGAELVGEAPAASRRNVRGGRHQYIFVSVSPER